MLCNFSASGFGSWEKMLSAVSRFPMDLWLVGANLSVTLKHVSSFRGNVAAVKSTRGYIWTHMTAHVFSLLMCHKLWDFQGHRVCASWCDSVLDICVIPPATMNALFSPRRALPAVRKTAEQGYDGIMQQNGAKRIPKVQTRLWMHDSAHRKIREAKSVPTVQPWFKLCYDRLT